MRTEHIRLDDPCPECGGWSATIGYAEGSNIREYLICDACGESLV